MMNEFTPPVHSLKTLFISTALASLLALIILVVAVLPAEYNIDPTGLGKIMGLNQLAPTKKSTPAISGHPKSHIPDAINITVVDPKRVEAQMAEIKRDLENMWIDTVTIIVPAMKGLEYKFYLEKGENLGFEWQTEGEKLHFDFHGEPKGNTTGYFKSYKLTTDNKSSGTLTTPFAGSHGWYWENKTQSPIRLILKTKGNYKILGLM
ncbi:MAG: hypothetical protein Q9M50_02900 [Methylococcales bacterium]|nr:hypothetical protein [Methylococcales bacterium]